MRALRMLTIAVGLGATLASASSPAMAQDTAATDAKANPAELAKQLQNPIAALISMPFENNPDWGAGARRRWFPVQAQHPAGDPDHAQPEVESDLEIEIVSRKPWRASVTVRENHPWGAKPGAKSGANGSE